MVTVPPKIAQNPIGINKRDIGNFAREEIRETTGKKSAAAPTFCINDEINATVPEIMGIIRFSEVPPIFKIKAATLLIIPVLSKPAPIIITAIMDITALLEKPSNKCAVSTKPCSKPIIGANKLVKPSTTIMVMAAMSTSTTSNANR